MHFERIWRKWLLMPFAWRHVKMPGRTTAFRIEPATELEVQLEANARKHIETLAGSIGERHKLKPDALLRTRHYISATFDSFGYHVTEHVFADGINLVAESSLNTGAPVILVGAHFDTVPGSPGANDNGSGIAALLELARLFAGKTSGIELRFVAFDNEEHVGQPPTAMGSHVYAQFCREHGEQIVGMWSLETLGYFSQEPNSQRYPSPFDLFYPTTGDFVAFVGNADSSSWVHRSIAAFRAAKAFPSEGVSAPQKLADINRSDQWGFWQAGYQALMVTDTANFRYPHYHGPEDTPDKVSFHELARVIRVLSETLSTLTRQ